MICERKWRHEDRKARDEKLKEGQVKNAGAALTAGHFLWWWWGWRQWLALSACFVGPAAPAISPLLPPPPSRRPRHRRVNTWQNMHGMSWWNWTRFLCVPVLVCPVSVNCSIICFSWYLTKTSFFFPSVEGSPQVYGMWLRHQNYT